MQLANCNDDLSSVKLDSRLIEALLLLEDFVKFSAVDKRHNEVEAGLRLEQIVHTTEERVISLKQDIFLQSSRLDLIILDQHVFADSLDCVFLASLRKQGQIDSAKSALAELQLNFEVCKSHIYGCGSFASTGGSSHVCTQLSFAV